jgi:DeoR family transcriptional regulator of aga operon
MSKQPRRFCFDKKEKRNESPDVETYPAEIRRARMLELIHQQEFVKVADLSRVFGISEVTVRSDLDVLAADGGVQRVHGGAMRSTGRPSEPSFEQSVATGATEKAAIGQAAAGLISDGESVFLDVGSTAAAVARALVARTDLEGVVVFTNGLNVALELEKGVPRLTVVVTGGTIRRRQHSLVNPMADILLSRINVATAIIGCNGVHSSEGITNINLPEADVKRRMIASAGRCVIVADGSKIEKVSVATVADLDQVDILITGRSAPPEGIQGLRDAGLSVLEAP